MYKRCLSEFSNGLARLLFYDKVFAEIRDDRKIVAIA
jgi:hypothetical protein